MKRQKKSKKNYNARNYLFKPEKDRYKPEKLRNCFNSSYIEYKSNGGKDKKLPVEDYLDEIKPYLSDIINDPKTQGELEIHLTMAINFFSSKNSEETRTMYSKSNDIEVMRGNET